MQKSSSGVALKILLCLFPTFCLKKSKFNSTFLPSHVYVMQLQQLQQVQAISDISFLTRFADEMPFVWPQSAQSIWHAINSKHDNFIYLVFLGAYSSIFCQSKDPELKASKSCKKLWYQVDPS